MSDDLEIIDVVLTKNKETKQRKIDSHPMNASFSSNTNASSTGSVQPAPRKRNTQKSGIVGKGTEKIQHLLSQQQNSNSPVEKIQQLLKDKQPLNQLSNARMNLLENSNSYSRSNVQLPNSMSPAARSITPLENNARTNGVDSRYQDTINQMEIMMSKVDKLEKHAKRVEPLIEKLEIFHNLENLYAHQRLQGSCDPSDIYVHRMVN